MKQPGKPKKPGEGEPLPGVTVGDELYLDHPAGPVTCKVLAHGKAGVTVHHEGKPHRVRWDKVLGHKKRATQAYKVLDEGEDGMIVEDARGQRQYLHIPPEVREEQMVVKADGGNRLVIFMKAAPVANRPGLTKKEITDKTGRHQTKWVRNAPEVHGEKKHAVPDADAGAAHGYGTHNLQAGDRVSFKAGDFEGSGEIVGEPGKDGAHIKDDSGRVHQVHWAEITGHDDKGGADKPKVNSQVLGSQEPVPADKFNATEYAKSHDKADVTPEEILAQFPEDTADKIKAVQERLSSIEQTIDKYKKDGKYSDVRRAIHDKIFDHFLSDERIKAATPEPGQKPTFTILGGRGGSGKSWFEGNVYDPDKAIVLDADHIKGMLPEYEGWNAAQVHSESGDIFDEITAVARELGLNVVHDATMKTAKGAVERVNAFKDAGYQTEAHYMHLPRQEAAKRAVSRFLGKTQRYVPVDVVLANTGNEASFDQVRQMVDKWSFRDNNVEQGKEPILISENGGENAAREESQQKSDKQLTKSEQLPMMIMWRAKS
jgi:predicted ABC-type ATPase